MKSKQLLTFHKKLMARQATINISLKNDGTARIFWNSRIKPSSNKRPHNSSSNIKSFSIAIFSHSINKRFLSPTITCIYISRQLLAASLICVTVAFRRHIRHHIIQNIRRLIPLYQYLGQKELIQRLHLLQHPCCRICYTQESMYSQHRS